MGRRSEAHSDSVAMKSMKSPKPMKKTRRGKRAEALFRKGDKVTVTAQRVFEDMTATTATAIVRKSFRRGGAWMYLVTPLDRQAKDIECAESQLEPHKRAED